MSFSFSTPSSSAAASGSTTSSAPAAGGLFGNDSGTSTPKFSFGNTGASTTTPANTGALFGQSGNAPAKPTFNLFGNTAASTATPISSAGGLLDASKPPAANALFSGASTTPASTPALGGGMFGNNQGSSTPATGGLFGNQNNASKPAAATPTPGGAGGGGLFAKSGSATSLFGNKTTAATPAAQATTFATTTPATTTPAKPTLPLPSTTPAGLPPSQNATKPATSGLFSNASAQPGGNLFGGAASKPTTAAPTTTAAAGGLFGTAGTAAPSNTGNLFGPKPSVTTSPAAGGLFAGTAPSTIQTASSTPAAAPASTGTTTSLFGAKPAAAASTPASTLTATGGLFGNTSAATTTATTAFTTSAATPAAAGGLFDPKSAATTTSSTNPAATASGNLFGGATPTAATTKPSSSLFGGASSSATTQPGAAGTTTTTATASTPATTSTSAGGLFGGASATSKEADKSKEAPKDATQTGTAANSLGASTRGPPSQMARLKNRTMEDIVTRWATDLGKYQKEFKEQATVISNWDRSLVENGEKIQKLYLDTFEAERASHEIERQLAAVESQQEELEAWLNRYETEVQDMASKQMGPGEQLGGPDQERECTYKLAEKLTQQLDEKSRDLSKMVKEINDISGTLSKGSKGEDPMSQIVRVLNSHLTQLQWIDANASALQAKVTAAQKSSSNLGSHYGGGDSDTTESFYRSYMGRR